MILITCPWCGTRSEEEYSFGGQAHIVRPSDPAAVSDPVWADYLHEKINPKGVNFELWRHTYGCRQWFHVARHTVSDGVLAVYRLGDPKPTIEA